MPSIRKTKKRLKLKIAELNVDVKTIECKNLTGFLLADCLYQQIDQLGRELKKFNKL